MKSFKSFLTESPTEWPISWQRHIMHIVFHDPNEDNAFLLLHPNIIKKAYGEHDKITAFHVTDERGLRQLIKIQNTNKAISCFTAHGHIDNIVDKITGDSNYKYNYGHHNNVLVAITGNLMAGYSNDISSRPDNRGIRGFIINNTSFATRIVHFCIDKIQYCKKKYPDIYYHSLIDYLRLYNGGVRVVIDDEDARGELKAFVDIVQENHPELLPKWYAEYYQICLDWFTIPHNKRWFARTYRNEDIYRKTQPYSYNEILLSHINIIRLLDIEALGDNYDEDDDHGIIEEIGDNLNVPVEIAHKEDDIISFIDTLLGYKMKRYIDNSY